MGCDYSKNYLTCAFFVILSDTTVNIGDMFCHFPCVLRVFFGYANETSRRRLGEDAGRLVGKYAPRGIFDFSVSEYRGGVFPHQSVAGCCQGATSHILSITGTGNA